MTFEFNIDNDCYDRWVRDFDTLSKDDIDRISHHIDAMKSKPVISIVMPVYETPIWILKEAIQSVKDQLYPYWQLCIADDASPSLEASTVCLNEAKKDPRIRFIRRPENGQIAAASNSASALATGEFLALMDHDDVLASHALYHVALAINTNSDLDIIYSDEDKINSTGNRQDPYFKTDWNPDLMLGHNIFNHLTVYRRELFEHIGGFRTGFEGSQDYDLALRAIRSSSAEKIHHIPEILYHWRRDYGKASFSEASLEKCCLSARKAILDHMIECNERGTVEPHPRIPMWNRVVRDLPDSLPLVSLIIPTRDKSDLLERCVEGILHRTTYSRIEILIVDNDSRERKTLKLFETLERDTRIRILKYPGHFNYAAINNFAVAKAGGSVIGLINNDIDVIDSDWLSEMVSFAVLPGVGAVGARLLYEDGRLQHGGVILGVGGVANHFNHLAPRNELGYFGRAVMCSTVSAVTGACLIVRKSIYDEVKGLDQINLAVAFNDVDFCLRIKELGYRNIWTPIELFHLESASRGADITPAAAARFQWEAEYMLKRWDKVLQIDPFYNINFSLDNGCFELSHVRRKQKPWLSSQ